MFELYDPTNIDNDYLEEDELLTAIDMLEKLYDEKNLKFIDTLEYIIFYEKNRRDEIISKRNLSDLEKKADDLNEKFRKKHKDWVHHDNKFYDEFYNIIDKQRRNIKNESKSN